MELKTDAQQQVIDTIDRSVAVVAAAGSGKTKVLIDRCLAVIDGDPARLERLLAITFTEKAAAELKSRLRPALPQRAHHRLATAWIGTFHGFLARILRQHAPLARLDPSFSIMDENASQLIMRNAVRSCLLKTLEERDPHAVNLVDALDFRVAGRLMEDLMSSRWHARRTLADTVTDDAAESTLLAAAARVYRLCEAAYREELAALNAIDFQEIEIRALDLLDACPDVLMSYRRRFRHLLIDEFQDTNDVQMELVLKLHDPAVNMLCIVGDPRQSIYRFRGANVDCFAAALKRIRACGGKAITLTQNFRSQPGIISFVNDASEHMSSGLFGTETGEEILTPAAERMQAARATTSDDPAVVMLSIEGNAELSIAERRRLEAARIARFVGRLTAEGTYALSDIVCLFQALTNTADYESAFEAAGIPFRFFGGRGLLDRQELCDLMHALRYAANPHDDVALLGLLRSPLIGLSDEDCVRLAGPAGTELRASARAHPSCGLLAALESAAAHERPSEIIRRVLDSTGYEHVVASLDPSGGMRAGIDRLITIAIDLERASPVTLDQFLGFMAHLRERNARLGDPPAASMGDAAVRCMTVHTAKGLEFPVVILPDLIRQEHSRGNAWIFHRQAGLAFKLKDPEHPFGTRIATARFDAITEREHFESSAEHARLLYVAMTRARDLLVLPLHRGGTIKGRWHEWLEPIAAAQDIPTAPDETGATTAGNSARPSKPAAPPHFFDREAIAALARLSPRPLSVSQIECFHRCPQEYYLKYVLRLPASAILSDSASGLAANIRGSIVHRVLETLSPRTADELSTMIRLACIEMDVRPDTATVATLERPIRAYMLSELFASADEGRRETRFDWRFGTASITGYIDWHRTAAAGNEIIDFKTDDVEAAGVALRTRSYELQLICYALALEDATGRPTAATTLVYLTPNIIQSVAMDEKRRQAGRARIEEILERIAREHFSLDGASPPCYTCPYHHNRTCWEDRLADHG